MKPVIVAASWKLSGVRFVKVLIKIRCKCLISRETLLLTFRVSESAAEAAFAVQAIGKFLRVSNQIHVSNRL